MYLKRIQLGSNRIIRPKNQNNMHQSQARHQRDYAEGHYLIFTEELLGAHIAAGQAEDNDRQRENGTPIRHQ
jgi:hypothetical protein